MAASTSAEAGGGTVAAGETVAGNLARLSAGALDWLRHNLDFFNPYSAGARLSGYRKAKAALELRLLHYCWDGLYPADGSLADVDDLIMTLWQLPDFQRLVTSRPDHPAYYALIYAAMAPAGIDYELRDATLAMLRAERYLSGAGQSPLMRLQTRYFADKAGVEHEIEPYEELIEQSILVKLPAGPVTIQQAYSITHASFFLSDFSGKSPGLDPGRLAQAVQMADRMLNYCARRDMWDLSAELVITLSCLGADPVSSHSGAAAIRCLARAQLPSGAIPGRSADQQADEPTSPADIFFGKAYHTTLMATLIPLIVARGRCAPREGH